jgi:titin
MGTGISVFNGSRENVIGPGNVIAYSKYSGIQVDDPATISNKITRNSIYSSGGSGISRSNGGNTQIPPPVITSAAATMVSGTAPPNAIIEIFSDDVDEGRVYEGTTTADSAGNFTFSKSAGFSRPYLTATATDANGNTTEFSAPKAKSGS